MKHIRHHLPLLLAALAAVLLAPPILAEPPADAGASETAETSESSVKPGINDTWKGDDIDRLVGVLEAEDREIWAERDKLAELVGALAGSTVADIGSGSGFMTVELARRVGEDGKVYAVDINPKMLKVVRKEAKNAKLGKVVETVLTGERTVDLPAGSLDLAFICDTYHHFEYPQSTLASLYEAVKPGGQVVVVEFHRIEGVSSQWTLDHVRAGREVFTREIEEAGFELVNVHQPPYLERNYVLRFRKPTSAEAGTP